MAEGLVFDAAGKILEVLVSQIFQEIGLAYGVQDEISELMGTVDTIKAVLADAEDQRNTKNHDAVTVWLRRLKVAFYEAEDLLDDFSTEFLRRKTMTGNKAMKEVCIFFSKYNQLAYALEIGHKIKSIRKRLESIKNDRQFHLTEHVSHQRRVENTRRETHSFVQAKDVIGRDDDKREIINRLLNSNDADVDIDQSVSVIPIVGIGGLGKTTVAQLVYNDENVQNYFNLKMWVCVSDDFDLTTIVEKIITSATQNKCEKLPLDQLQQRLRGAIAGKKYLLVLDDVWNDNRDRWLQLETLLMNGVSGSKIIVTTRSERVAKVTSMLPSHVLKGLSEDMSWSLFKQMAFQQGLEPKESKLVQIGKDIVAKCIGVPLSIRTIGSLLYQDNAEASWLHFRDNELSKIHQEESGILPKLRLSYDNLPSSLKQCFAYCAVFSKDYEIEKEQLILLWMAEGLLGLSNENQCPEDFGNQRFMSLLSRSFFQGEYDERGDITKCKIHDLLHDLAKSVMGIECGKEKLDAGNVDESTRHISLAYDFGSFPEFPTALLRAKNLRTFLSLERQLNESYCKKILSSFKHLRTLNLSQSDIGIVPSSIGKLKHLRYLNLSHNGIEKLPNSVSRLVNLQTLDLSFCDDLVELPKDIGKMVSLRHLLIESCLSLIDVPKGLGRLTSLHTLPLFVLSRKTELSVLNGLNKLRGRLIIENLGHMQNSSSANLEAKEYLRTLELRWGDPNKTDVETNETLLEGLKPHQNLQDLTILRFEGIRLSSWLSSLTNLTRIDISNCMRCQYIPQLDQLPSLRWLRLFKLSALEYISSSSTSTPPTTIFPSLEDLRIFACPELKGWWRIDDTEDGSTIKMAEPSFPCLSRLTIEDCPKLISMPLYPSLERLYCRFTSSKLFHQTIRFTASSVAPPPFSKLKSLSIGFIDDIEFSPEEWMRNFSSIVQIQISSCPSLTSQLSQGIRHLTSLEEMVIENCEDLDLLDDDDDDDKRKWHGLKSLRTIEFNGVQKLVSLPQGLKSVISLQNVRIRDCPNMMTLPDGLQLQSLNIINSPQFLERYGNNSAVDWPKIAHIPNIQIDYQWIQLQGCYQLNG